MGRIAQQHDTATVPRSRHHQDIEWAVAYVLVFADHLGSRDQFGTGNKFITPTIANGKVFVGTTNSVGVFGLLP